LDVPTRKCKYSTLLIKKWKNTLKQGKGKGLTWVDGRIPNLNVGYVPYDDWDILEWGWRLVSVERKNGLKE